LRIGVYPGSFDPITYGHIDVVERSLTFLDKVIIAVANDSKKKFLFSLEERMNLIKSSFEGRKNIESDELDGLLVDYLEKKDIHLIIRGLRAVSDFEYEFQMALTNRKLKPGIDTIFLMPSEEYFYISSSVVKEIAGLKGDVKKFVPADVEKALRNKFQK